MERPEILICKICEEEVLSWDGWTEYISHVGFFMPSLPAGAGSHCGLTQSGRGNLTVPLRPLLFLLVLLSSCQAEPYPVFASEVWIATGYDACVSCCGKTDGITASGVKASPRKTIAVNWLPFGTRLKINGQTYLVQDRGAVSHFGSRSHPKKRVDIFFASHKEALQFGRKKVNVEEVL